MNNSLRFEINRIILGYRVITHIETYIRRSFNAYYLENNLEKIKFIHGRGERI